MQYLKLKILVFVLVTGAFGQKFTSKECLDSSFETSIKSKGKFFGLIKNDISISKNKCKVTFKHKGILESVWSVDLCREPIHMKVLSKGSENVFKRQETCSKESTSDFCYYLKELKSNISDYGLIFAEGLREKLKDPHGQVYCTSLLLDRYFDDQVVFSLFTKPQDIYSEKTEGCELPETQSEISTPVKMSEESKIESSATKVLDNVEEVSEPLTDQKKF
jgi:hypothetical protein